MMKITDLKIEQELNNYKYIKPFKLTYKQNETDKCWEMVQTVGSVVIIIFNTSRQVLVCVKQFRPPVYMSSIPKEERESPIDTVKYPLSLGISLEFCAGMMDKSGKSIEETAAEEVLEETGYQVKPEHLEKIKSYKCSVGTSGESQTLFYTEVTDDMRISEGGGVDDEFVSVVELTLNEAKQILQDPTFQGPGEFLFALLWFFTNKCK